MTDAYLAQVVHQRDEAQRDRRACEDELGQLRRRASSLTADLARTEAERDGAYRERAQLTAWLAALHPAVLAPAPDVDEDGWQILYLAASGQQLSWHIHPRDAELFGHVEQVPAEDPRAQWDGHTTAEKYQRIEALTAADQRQDTPAPIVSVLVDGEWKPVPGIASVQFHGLDLLSAPGPVVPHHPPIPGTASRQVPLDHMRLGAQVHAVLQHSTPTV